MKWNEKPENKQLKVSLPLSHPHATILTKFTLFFSSKYEALDFPVSLPYLLVFINISDIYGTLNLQWK